eukprot:1175537-Prorocentrum_minimum.AAC.1
MPPSSIPPHCFCTDDACARGALLHARPAQTQRTQAKGKLNSSVAQRLVKGYDVDVKGYNVDVNGYDVDAKGYDVDVKVKGYDVDVKGFMDGSCLRRFLLGVELKVLGVEPNYSQSLVPRLSSTFMITQLSHYPPATHYLYHMQGWSGVYLNREDVHTALHVRHVPSRAPTWKSCTNSHGTVNPDGHIEYNITDHEVTISTPLDPL